MPPEISASDTRSGKLASTAAIATLVLATALLHALGYSAFADAADLASRCTIHGTPGPDVLHGTAGTDVICGAGGADRLFGGKGDDVILGGAGGDHLSGGPGRDVEKGGSGADVCLGNAEEGDQISCRVTRMSGTATSPADSEAGGSGPTPPPVSEPLVEPPNRTGTPEECEHATSFCRPVPQLPPTIFEARLSTETVDTSLGDAEPTVDLVIGDEEEVSSGTAVVEGPDGSLQTLTIPSTGGLGSYSVYSYRKFDVELPFKVPGSAVPGRYQLVGVNLRDPSGREATFHREELDALLEYGCACRPGHPWLQAYQGPDVTPPVLTGISQDQEEVLPDGIVYIQWSMEATDYQSGVDHVGWTIREGSATSSGGGSWLKAGSVTEAVIGESSLFEVYPWSTGSWPILGVTVTDTAGNTAVYTREDLEAAGLTTELTESG